MTFPTTEAGTTQLADEMIEGMPKDAVYGTSPITPAQLSGAEADFNAANGDMNAAYAAYLTASQEKTAKYNALQNLMKQVINFALNIQGVTQAQLKLIGWDTKAAPKELQAPGQCVRFELVSMDGDLYDFDWMKPKDGGKVAVYELVVRAAGTSKWALKANDTKRDLEEAFELDAGHWEVAVRAVNDAGTGPVSNVVVLTVA